MKIEINQISTPILNQKGINFFLKRIDKIQPFISGNKWFKLKYNLDEAKQKGYDTILTFGGAYSNHISATSYACKKNNFKCIGIIRGEEHQNLNTTLKFARDNGMFLYYISREKYRLKDTVGFLEDLKLKFGNFYLIPEGGNNDLAIKGTSEILDKYDMQDYICCPVGTGGTITGLINTQLSFQNVIGFPVINDSLYIEDKVASVVNNNNFTFINDYKTGGYAKYNESLINFINDFYEIHNIPLDIIYTGKMIYGIFDLVYNDFFPRGSSILAIHTGGIQGNRGMIDRFDIKLPLK